jgi:hypothetical protein
MVSVLPFMAPRDSLTADRTLRSNQNRHVAPGLDDKFVNLNHLAKSAKARGVVLIPDLQDEPDN